MQLKKNRGIFELFLKIAITFVLSLAMVVLVMGIVLSATLFNSAYAANAMEKENYYETVADTLLLQCVYYFEDADLMQQLLPQAITEEEVRTSILYNLDEVYEGSLKKQDITQKFDYILHELESSLRNAGVSATDEMHQVLNDVVSDCERAYAGATTIPFSSVLVVWVSNFRGIFQILLFLISAFFIFQAAYLLFHLCKDKKLWLSWVCSALLGAGLMLAVPAAVIMAQGWVRNLISSERIFYGVYNRFTNGILVTLAAAGCLIVIVGIAVILLQERQSRYAKRQMALSAALPIDSKANDSTDNTPRQSEKLNAETETDSFENKKDKNTSKKKYKSQKNNQKITAKETGNKKHSQNNKNRTMKNPSEEEEAL